MAPGFPQSSAGTSFALPGDVRKSTRGVLAAILLTMPCSVAAAADSPAARIVGLNFFRQPLVVNSLTAREIATLAAAAGVPMGFEAAVVDEPHVINVQATGKPLGAVLDEIVAADRRYEWRDENGVIVLRPAAAWTDRNNPLHRNLDAIRFADVGDVDALSLMVAMFGQELDASQRTASGDARRFDLDLPPGTVLEALNGIVRAHGKLSWAIEPVRAKGPLAPGTTLSPFMVWLGTDSGGAHGIGIHLDRSTLR